MKNSRVKILTSFALSSVLFCLGYIFINEYLTNSNSTQYIEARVELIKNEKPLTLGYKKANEAFFSVDNSKILFQAVVEGENPFYQIFIRDIKTASDKRVTTNRGRAACGYFHPRLDKIIWSSTHLDPHNEVKVKNEKALPEKLGFFRNEWAFDDNYDIFESDLNGNNIKNLTLSPTFDIEAVYSHDGNEIIFSSTRSRLNPENYTQEEHAKIKQNPYYATDIYKMNADGSNVKRLTSFPGHEGAPFYNGDSTKITFRRFTVENKSCEIFVMNSDGTSQTQLTYLNNMSWAPFFHPSGEYIIFSSYVDKNITPELFIVDAKGGSLPIRVTHNRTVDYRPSFSIEGDKILWTKMNSSQSVQIYQGDWDHSKALKLIQNSPRFKH